MENNLFLDLSSHATGYCVAQEDKSIVESGVIKSSSQDVLKRISIMEQGVVDLINKYDIKKVVAEEVHQDLPSNRAYQVLLNLQGVILLAIYKIDKNIPVEFMQSSTWRSRIGIRTGRGIKREELKQADINYVKDHYNLTVTDDEADAICLMNAYYTPVQGHFWGK